MTALHGAQGADMGLDVLARPQDSEQELERARAAALKFALTRRRQF